MNALYKRIVTIAMISITAILAWIYCILEYRNKPVYIICISIVVIVSIFGLLYAYIKLKEEKDLMLQNHITETIMNSFSGLNTNDSDYMERLNKATYVQIRKTNTILSRMAEEKNNQLIADSINKAVKIIVKYNQNNNDNVVEAVNALLKSLDNIGNVTVSPMPQSAEFTATPVNEDFDVQDSEPVAEGPDMQDSEPVAESPDMQDSEPASEDPNRQLSPDEIAALIASMNG